MNSWNESETMATVQHSPGAREADSTATTNIQHPGLKDADTSQWEAEFTAPTTPVKRPDVPTLLRTLRDEGPQERIAAVFEEHYIEAWFGLDPVELRSVLNAATEREVRTRPIVGYIRSLLRGETVPLLSDVRQNGVKTLRASERGAVVAMAVLESRLRGELSTAMQLAERLGADAPAANALVDGSLGTASFMSLQAGITRMLAGDFARALADLERVKWTAPPAALTFFVRDAHAKAALVHAIAGDPELARRALASARQVQRTNSWAEALVDATAQLAEVIIDRNADSTALGQLLATGRTEIGEMWPLFILSLAPAVLSGDAGAAHMLAAMEGAALPGSKSSQGLTGSAAALVRAAQAAEAGHLSEARAALVAADPDLPLTKLVQAGAALDSGMPGQALAIALDVAAHTAGLRQLELWRLSILHLGHRALGEEDAAQASLDQARPLAAGLGAIALPVSGSARAQIQSLLHDVPLPATAPTALSLTPRELEVLVRLAAGISRREIAEQLFVSINTIKTQVSSLYRKLGVRDRGTLLAEAYRRGLI